MGVCDRDRDTGKGPKSGQQDQGKLVSSEDVIPGAMQIDLRTLVSNL